MSWQSYIDEQLMNTTFVKNAVIAGHDGNIWAASANFNVTVDELKKLLANYDNEDALAPVGARFANTKYLFISKSDRVLRFKKDRAGAHCIKTVQALIVCIYDEPTVPGQCAAVTEKLGEYLISVGY